MERTLGINADSPGIIGIFGSPQEADPQETIKKPLKPEMRAPKRSARRTTMVASQFNQSLRNSGIMPPPSIKIQPPR